LYERLLTAERQIVDYTSTVDGTAIRNRS
jgi:hypothetical protein